LTLISPGVDEGTEAEIPVQLGFDEVKVQELSIQSSWRTILKRMLYRTPARAAQRLSTVISSGEDEENERG
jgi:hypothetical protein